MAVVAPLLVVLQGQLVKQRTGETGWDRKRDGIGMKRRQDNFWLVEILFTNVAREDSQLTVVLFTN